MALLKRTSRLLSRSTRVAVPDFVGRMSGEHDGHATRALQKGAHAALGKINSEALRISTN